VSARDSVHVNKCFEKTDNADTRCDVIKGGAGDGHPRHETSKTVAAVFPASPALDLQLTGYHLCG